MNKIIVVLLCIALMSCNSGKKFKKENIRHSRLLLENAFKTGDIQTAIMASQSILIYDTANIGLLDTLANLYLQLDDQGSAFQTSIKILNADPKNLNAIKVFTNSAAKLNRSQDALSGYLKLWEFEKKTAYLYEAGVQNYNIGNAANGQKIIESVIAMPESKTEPYLVMVGEGKYQQVPVLAMCYYFLGTYNELMDQKTLAREQYSMALQLAPDFVLAKNKLSGNTK